TLPAGQVYRVGRKVRGQRHEALRVCPRWPGHQTLLQVLPQGFQQGTGQVSQEDGGRSQKDPGEEVSRFSSERDGRGRSPAFCRRNRGSRVCCTSYSFVAT